MRILVTGSSGMIGTALVDALTKLNHEVIGLDIKEPTEKSDAPYVLHDLRTPITPEVGAKLLEKPIDFIVHLAANARVYQLVLDPDRALDNIIMTHQIFEFARKNAIPRLLFASSRETYGNGNELPVKEPVASQRCAESIYTVSKISGEGYCYAYSHCYGMDARVMRYSNVYGRFDLSDRFVPKAIQYLKQGKTFSIYGEGKTLDFTYLDDAVAGTIALIENWEGPVQQYREYNIASGEQATLYEVAQLIKKLLNSSSDIVIDANLTGEVMNYQADITRLRSLGWEPKVKLDEGLGLALAYYDKLFS